jgi:histidinol phosphatase-like PHP family hydrolase
LADLDQASTRGRSFRARAYRRAVWSLDDLSPELIESPEEVLEVPGIGAGIARLYEEFRQSGNLAALETLSRRLPSGAAALSRLPRMTPPRLLALKAELGVESISDLGQAIVAGAAETLPGVGRQTTELWVRALGQRRPGTPIYTARAFAERLAQHVESKVLGSAVELNGAVAHLEDWVDEIDLRIAGGTGVLEFFEQSALTTAYERVKDGVRLETLGGSVSATIVRSRAKATRSAGAVLLEAVKGDLHTHSDWSPDGRQSLSDLVASAVARGYEYVGVTDHAVGLRFGGLDAERLRAQRVELDKIRGEFPDIAVLHGIELNIDRDGEVDFDTDLLAWLDFTVAGFHSLLSLGADEQTARALKAVANPEVDIIAHLTGRRIGIRPPIELDLPVVLRAAAANGTVLEVNGHLDRLDLSVELIEMAVDYGVLFVANSDAHRPAELANIENACVLLERAGVGPASVVNTWSLGALKTRL